MKSILLKAKTKTARIIYPWIAEIAINFSPKSRWLSNFHDRLLVLSEAE